MYPGLHEIFGKLTAQNALLATAESLTGGLIAERITEQPGASRIFWGGWVTYSEQAKCTALGVPEHIVQRFGVVSKETAAAMAEHAAAFAAVSSGTLCYAVAVTGIAGPSGGTSEAPVGTVYIACAENCPMSQSGSVLCRNYLFNGTRSNIREQTYEAAMTMLLKQLDKAKNKKIQ